MIKKISLLSAALFSFCCATAQETSTETSNGTKFGVKAGLNVATVTGDVEDVNAIAAAHAGFFAEVSIGNRFYFQPELLYSMQGGKSSGTIVVDGTLYDVKEHLKLSYLNIPLIFKFKPQPKLSFLAGPQLGLLIAAKDKVKVTDGFVYGSETVDVKDELESFDVALAFGIGYDFTNEFFGEARYCAGITNINASDDGKMQNGVFQLSLGYRFN